jgi:hypothetical protein
MPNKRKIMRAGTLAAVTAFSYAVTGCGGDGGGTVSAPVPLTLQLAAYIGTWAGDCSNHAMDTTIISRPSGSTDTVNIATKTEYFSAVNCTGTVLATETNSADISATYATTVDSSVVLAPSTAAVAVKVDKVTASWAQHTATVAGPGIVRTVVNGQAQWCIDFGGGSSTCVHDMGVIPAQTGASGGLYSRSNEMFVLSPSGSTFTVDQHFTKK